MTIRDALQTLPTAVIVAGMHRSGTSLAASMLADVGVHLGDTLMGPGEGNPEGHFEDLEILAFHRRVLAANGLGTDGFTAQREIPVPPAVWPESRALVATRRGRGIPWGWKEPRTTLFLDHWAEAVPEARFVLLFRRPWEVIDSLFRRGDDPFAIHPPLAIAVWRRYNQAVRDFHERHADRCLLVELTQLTVDPTAFAARLRQAFSLAAGGCSPRFKPGLLAQDADSPRAGLLATIDEEAFDLYLDLRSRAGSSSPLPSLAATRGQLATGVLSEWRRAAAAERRAADAEAATENGPSTSDAADPSPLVAEVADCRLELQQAGVLIHDLKAHIAGRHEEIVELRRLLADRDERLASAAATAAALEAGLEAARGASREQAGSLAALREELTLSNAQRDDLARRLEAAGQDRAALLIGLTDLERRLRSPLVRAGDAIAAGGRRVGRECRRLGRQVERALRSCRDRLLRRRHRQARPAATAAPDEIRPAA